MSWENTLQKGQESEGDQNGLNYPHFLTVIKLLLKGPPQVLKSSFYSPFVVEKNLDALPLVFHKQMHKTLHQFQLFSFKHLATDSLCT